MRLLLKNDRSSRSFAESLSRRRFNRPRILRADRKNGRPNCLASTQHTVVPRQKSEKSAPAGIVSPGVCRAVSASERTAPVAACKKYIADCLMCGSRVDKNPADMLCSELNTDCELVHSSRANFRFRLESESKPDHNEQTCSNQLLIKSDEVSVMRPTVRGVPSKNCGSIVGVRAVEVISMFETVISLMSFVSTMELDRAKRSSVSVQELVVHAASPRIEVASSMGNSSFCEGPGLVSSATVSNIVEDVAAYGVSGLIVEPLLENVGDVPVVRFTSISPG